MYRETFGKDGDISEKALESTVREGGNTTRQSSCSLFTCENVYLVKTALSFLASTVSRMVSLPAPVVIVSVVTVSLDVDSVLPSSSSLSELLEEELSDATSGAFLATHALHTQAVEVEEEQSLSSNTNMPSGQNLSHHKA